MALLDSAAGKKLSVVLISAHLKFKVLKIFFVSQEPSRNLLCIVSNFDMRSDHLQAILKAVFLVQRQKTFNPPYFKITFSTYVGNSQSTAELYLVS